MSGALHLGSVISWKRHHRKSLPRVLLQKKNSSAYICKLSRVYK